MVSKHPKVTVYIPKKILQGLDDWKQVYDIESRSEAIVTILEDYLEASFLEQYEEQQESAAPPRIRLSMLLSEIYELKERMSALEEQLSTAHGEVPSAAQVNPDEAKFSDVLSEAPNTALVELAESGEAQSNALEEQLSTALSTAHGEVPSTTQANPDESKSSDVLSEAPSTALTKAPLTPLTQSALAKRLGYSVKVVERHRKQGKESFASWSRQHDPDDLAWRWEGRGVRGNPLRFMPAATKAE